MELLPVGHDLGEHHDGEGGRTRQVRVGAELAELDDARYAVWAAAHGTADADGRVSAVEERALRAAHGDAVVDELLERRLLARTAPAVEFAERHRLVPLALGLGNTEEQPYLFSAGLLYQPVVAMTGALYDLWQWAHLSPDLWWACRELASVAVRAGVTEPEQTDPDQVLTGALGSLPQLLAARVACFDVRIEGR
ncbi:hypothetical protein [Actinophytocola sp. KF-1]